MEVMETSSPCELWVAIAQASHEVKSGDCARVVSRRDGCTMFFVGDVAGHDARAGRLAADLDAHVSELAELSSPGASHYFHASLPHQLDELVWFDETRAVEPLRAGSRPGAGLPGTRPLGAQ